MENNSQTSPVDLTLRLGVSTNDKQTSEENKAVGSRGFSSVHNQVLELGGSSSSRHGGGEVGSIGAPLMPLTRTPYAPELSLQQGFLPQNRAAPVRRRHNTDDEKVCKSCGVVSTPLWRKGPDGPQTLCNACGLRYARTIRKNGE
ncbi:hypothetical protein Pfo_006567 [Paulownia fortunei]|nr:hypothetical protein Pfo_006567 [Paulownia fortunei]